MDPPTQARESRNDVGTAGGWHNPIAGRRVLVTGAAGFLGPHLCRALAGAGARVHAVARRPPQDGAAESVTWSQADCADSEALRSLLADIRPQLIYHLTSCGLGGQELRAVLPTLREDLVACVNMLTVATETGCERFILAGSLEEPPTMDRPPNSPYAAAKACSAMYARMFHQVFHTPVTVVRPYMTYGPGQRPEKIIPSIVLSALHGHRPVIASADRSIDWVFVDDVVQAMIAAGDAPGVDGMTIDLGSGAGVTIREVAERIVSATGTAARPSYGGAPGRRSEIVRVADVVLARERLGWTSTTSLDDGLRQTVEWFRGEVAAGRYVAPPGTTRP